MKDLESLDIDFAAYLQTLKRRWKPGASIFFLTVALATFATTRLKPSYTAQGKILFKADRTPALTLGEEESEISSIVSNENPLSTQIEIIYSDPLLQKTVETLNLSDIEGEPLSLETLESNLQVKIVGGTDVIRLAYQSKDPQQTAVVVNTLMRLYIENDILTKKAETTVARNLILQQLPRSSANVKQAETALRNFREQNDIVSLEEEAQSAVEVIAELDSDISTIQAELEEANAQSLELQNKIGLNSRDALLVSSLSQSTAVQTIMAELVRTNTELANTMGRLEEAHPIIMNLKAQQANLEILLNQEIQKVVGSGVQVSEKLLQIGQLRQDLIATFLQSEVQRLGLVKKLESLSQSRIEHKQRTRTIPQLEQQQGALERKLKVAQTTYETLLTNIQEIEVREKENTGNARIIEQATVPDQGSSKKSLVLALGVIAGGFLSTATIFLLELRDNSLKTIKEVKKQFPYPLLGTIPLEKSSSLVKWRQTPTAAKVTVLDAPHSPISEIYRLIQATWKWLNVAQEPKVIVVTSSVPQEGKSTVTANLAAAIAQLGYRILLIDGDLRRPCQDQTWSVSNAVGLSDVLTGHIPLSSASHKVSPNLDLLTAGMVKTNPFNLLGSNAFRALIKKCSTNYDMVIIDTPPLIIAVDALKLSSTTDGMVLVARPGIVDRESSDTVKQMIANSGQKVLGLIINGVNARYEPNSYLRHAQDYYQPQQNLINTTD